MLYIFVAYFVELCTYINSSSDFAKSVILIQNYGTFHFDACLLTSSKNAIHYRSMFVMLPVNISA